MNLADWLTAILTPLTFGFVLYAELRHRRQQIATVLFLEHSESKDNLHKYRLSNLGTHGAMSLTVSATSRQVREGKNISLLTPGDERAVSVWSESLGRDWLLFKWIDTADARYLVYQWFPLTDALSEAWIGQLEERARRHPFARLRPKVKMVGPGAGDLRTRVRRGRGERTSREVSKAERLLDVTQEQRIREIEVWTNENANTHGD